MKVRVILLMLIVGFFLNGCLADKIKQRMYYLKMKGKIAQQQKKRVVKSQKVSPDGTRRVVTRSHKKLYTPSSSELIKPISDVEEITPVTMQHRKVVKKRKKTTTVKTKEKVVRKSRSHKKTKKVVKKSYEPYSIEDEKKDPELLGPQTTLEANPLLEKKGKI